MSTSSVPLDYDNEQIACAGCGKSETVTQLRCQREWSQLPADWFVADTYPPGDGGLQFACSPECVTRLVEHEAWESSLPVNPRTDWPSVKLQS